MAIFQDGGGHHLRLSKFENFNGWMAQECRSASPCQIWSTAELLPRYGNFLFFQDGGRPPFWICCVGVWTSREGCLVVFITVQNLVLIDAVVSIICKF